MNPINTNESHPGLHQFASLLITFDNLDVKRLLGQAGFKVNGTSLFPADLVSVVAREPRSFSSMSRSYHYISCYEGRLRAIVHESANISLFYVGCKCELFEDNYALTFGLEEAAVLDLDRRIREALNGSVDEEHPGCQDFFARQAMEKIGAEYFHILQKIHEG